MLAIMAVVLAMAVPGSERLDGRWTGAIQVVGSTLQIAVEFATEVGEPRATIDIPQQGARALVLTALRVAPPKVHFELVAGPGLGVFEGELSGGVIHGSFTQGGVAGTFSLEPTVPRSAETPLPYKAEDVTVTRGDVRLAGTLTLPASAGRHPAVALLTGSGAQDRDEEVAGFRSFRLLADHLTRAGVVVLRCDDRGVGGSSGSLQTVTSEDLADDALAAVAFLKGRAEVDPARVGLLGHSEGGVLAVMAAARSRELAFIVLVASPGVKGETLMRAQAEAIYRAEHKSEAEVGRLLDLQARAFQVARTGEGADALASLVREETRAELARLPAERLKAMGDPEPIAERAAQAQLAAARSPWLRFFLQYDPAQDLARVRCPVLALYGEKDLQVPARLNRQALESALARAADDSVAIHVLPAANHLFQVAGTGSPSEYARLPKEFVPGFLDTIARFVTTLR